MGVFKDGFDAIKGAKELGDYHGGMPSMEGSFKDINARHRRPRPERDPEVGHAGQGAGHRVRRSRCPTTSSPMQIELDVTRRRGRPVHGHVRVPAARA